MTNTKPLREPILPDDYPIYAGYCYVADGQVIISDWHARHWPFHHGG